MLQIGTVQTLSYISKPHVKCKVLKHIYLRKEAKSKELVHLFVYFSVMNVGLLQMP